MSKRVYHTSTILNKPFQMSKRMYEMCTITTPPFQTWKRVTRWSTILRQLFLQWKCVSRTSTILPQPFQQSKYVQRSFNCVTHLLMRKHAFRTSTILQKPFLKSPLHVKTCVPYVYHPQQGIPDVKTRVPSSHGLKNVFPDGLSYVHHTSTILNKPFQISNTCAKRVPSSHCVSGS